MHIESIEGRSLLNAMYHELILLEKINSMYTKGIRYNEMVMKESIEVVLERTAFIIEQYKKEQLGPLLEELEITKQPRDYERGWKDTVKVDAGKVTKIIMHWKDHVGNYMWHCHFLEHEDHDMMRPILVMKDVHAVQQPHAEIEQPTHHEATTSTTTASTPTTNTTSTTHHNESPAPLLNASQIPFTEEEEIVESLAEESTHIGNNDQHRPILLFPPTTSTRTDTNRPRPRRPRRF
ncbi:multicopper oxidase domain-containing protein [Streptomyces sp. NPDC051130]|uniref:multicopper oxidase domain-containing protein n=1 Tax=Streptomyces sp. NPDC051130 TaxID=3157223 RepID=UPI003423DEBE